VKIGVATTASPSEAILPVLFANIGSANGLFKCENVLLDSGAQVSLIRQDNSETLGLKGKDVSITITKVGDVTTDEKLGLERLQVAVAKKQTLPALKCQKLFYM